MTVCAGADRFWAWGSPWSCCRGCRQQRPSCPLWELGLGVAGLSLPHYRGADESGRWLLPTPYAVYRGEVLRANRDGVKAMLFDTDQEVDLDLSLAAARADARRRRRRRRTARPGRHAGIRPQPEPAPGAWARLESSSCGCRCVRR